mgnify:FL=1
MNDRGRIPFAIVGVLLVLSSTTLATTAVFGPSGDPPAIDDAMDGATATAATELRDAVDTAATNAAIGPVTEPSETAAGRALDDTQPFRDSLRLRIYLRAVERLEGIETTRDGVTVSASLPPVERTTEGYRTAIERVEIERTGEDGAALTAEIDGVRLSAARDGREVTTVDRSPNVTVSNPALLLHDRTDRFETRANAPVTRSGLGQRLTTRLYPIAWVRGYAQYGGAPISTVLGVRHVEFATNDALLAEQRSVFGEPDPDGHRGVAAAGERVYATDAIVGLGGDEAWVDTVLEKRNDLAADPPSRQPVGTWREEPEDTDVTVGVNASADHAFAETIGVAGDDRLGEVVERVHTVEARVETSSTFSGRSRRGSRSPGGGWRLTSTSTDVDTSVRRVGSGGPSAAGWTTIDAERHEVTVTRTTTRGWRDGNETTTTRLTEQRRYRVGVSTQGRTVDVENVPDGRIDGALADAADRASARAIRGVGGFGGAAEATALDESTRSTATATATPSLERSAVESDLGSVRDHAADVSVTVPGPALGTGRVNPSERLTSAFAAERDDLVTEADRTAEERTIRAARLEYLDALDAELKHRRSAAEDTGDGIADRIGDHIDADRLDDALSAHREPSDPDAEPIDDPAGGLSLSVDTGPSYLTTDGVTRDRIDERGGGTVHPLATRTINVFSSPHGQVADGIFDRISFLNTERVSLSTAARTLDAMEPGMSNRAELETEVEDATEHVRGELVADLVDAGVPAHEAEAALRRDVSPAAEALMLTNGTTVDHAARAIDGPPSRERAELRLETTLDSALEDDTARPTEPTTTAAQEAATDAYSGELEDMLADGLEAGADRARAEVLGERLGAVPAGLPILPVPGYWFATANVWHVHVSGQYERFAVRSNRSDGAASTTYLRDDSVAWVDNGDDDLRLGTASSVSFETETAVVVVVPPGPRGVGDTDGEPIKRSPGWSGG